MGQKLVFDFYPIITKDPRNTDNAWIETVALHFHDEKGDKVASKLEAQNDLIVFPRWLRCLFMPGTTRLQSVGWNSARRSGSMQGETRGGTQLKFFRLLSLQKTDHHTFQPQSGCQGSCGKVGGTLVNKGRPNKRKSKINTAAVLSKKCLE